MLTDPAALYRELTLTQIRLLIETYKAEKRKPYKEIAKLFKMTDAEFSCLRGTRSRGRDNGRYENPTEDIVNKAEAICNVEGLVELFDFSKIKKRSLYGFEFIPKFEETETHKQRYLGAWWGVAQSTIMGDDMFVVFDMRIEPSVIGFTVTYQQMNDDDNKETDYIGSANLIKGQLLVFVEEQKCREFMTLNLARIPEFAQTMLGVYTGRGGSINVARPASGKVGMMRKIVSARFEEAKKIGWIDVHEAEIGIGIPAGLVEMQAGLGKALLYPILEMKLLIRARLAADELVGVARCDDQPEQLINRSLARRHPFTLSPICAERQLNPRGFDRAIPAPSYR